MIEYSFRIAYLFNHRTKKLNKMVDFNHSKFELFMLLKYNNVINWKRFQ